MVVQLWPKQGFDAETRIKLNN